jgi:pilus assembly protein CpaE
MTSDQTSNGQASSTTRRLRVGAWCRSLGLERAMRAEEERLPEMLFSIVPRAPGAAAAAAVWADDCEVLIVDVDLAEADELALLSRIVEMRGPRRPVIATAADGAVDDVRRLMRLGIADFLPQPIAKTDFEHSLRSVSQRLAQDDAMAKRGAVALFTRAAGGAGATTLATHFAYALTARTPQRKIALLDLDLQRGTAGLHLDITADVGVVSCLERFPEIEPGLIESVANKHASGMDVFTATANHWPLDDYSPHAIAQMLDVMRRVYDWVVVDAPPAWTRWQHALLERTDIAVVVTQKTVAGLRQTRTLIGALEAALKADQILTVCNRVQTDWLGRGIAKTDADLALGRSVDFAVPGDDALVREAADLGVPVSRVKRGSKFEKATNALADGIEQRLARRRLDPHVAANGAVCERMPTTREEWTQDARVAV